jgi:hypothetical protein
MRIHPPLLLQSQDPWAKTSQPTKIHKPTGVAKWGGGDFCTMERLCLSSDGSPYGNQKLQKILLPISAKKSKQSNRCEPHRREWREKMQSGFLSCILCSLLILLQTLYDKLLVDKGSKAIVTTLHFSGNWNFCRLQIRPFLWTYSSSCRLFKRERERERERERAAAAAKEATKLTLFHNEHTNRNYFRLGEISLMNFVVVLLINQTQRWCEGGAVAAAASWIDT